ncbi:DsbA family protein [Cupriavidus pauculus]|jgi:protein-disulfide isomerase|uniref:DsbA family protein n=1 Tax=Cupriavidus pauculus TaxID=82633 RepID=UPI000780FF9B|nr:thioredoxin domain-containing protein [Cupriavidus pauculus]
MRLPGSVRSRRFVLLALLTAALLLVAAAWTFLRPHAAAQVEARPASHAETVPPTPSPPATPSGPPWRYGRPDARFTVVEYADLECSFCRTYFPVLKRWIDSHPEVNWQWHHLPLTMHEPVASAEARLVECIGETGGPAAFWQAVDWVYARTRGDGQGLPERLRYPDLTPATQQCLDSDRPDATIRTQAAEAARNGVTATPALQLRDRETGRTLLLHGPVEGDALLSALDLISTGAEPSRTPDMPAASIGDMPR